MKQKIFPMLAVFVLLSFLAFAAPPSTAPGDPPIFNTFECANQPVGEFFDSPDGCISLVYSELDRGCDAFPATLSVYESTCTYPEVWEVVVHRSYGVTAVYRMDNNKLLVVIDEASGLVSLMGDQEDDYRQRCGQWYTSIR